MSIIEMRKQKVTTSEPLVIIITAMLILTFLPDASADYEPRTFFEVIGTANLIAVGKISDVYKDDYNFVISERIDKSSVTAGQTVRVRKFQNWTCAERQPYAPRQEMLVALRKIASDDEKDRFAVIGAGNEGEMFIYNNYLYLGNLEGLPDWLERTCASELQQGRISGRSKHSLTEAVCAIKDACTSFVFIEADGNLQSVKRVCSRARMRELQSKSRLHQYLFDECIAFKQDVRSLLHDFQSSQWPTVHRAKILLEDMKSPTILEIVFSRIINLGPENHVVLCNTNGVIFPDSGISNAELVLDYEVNWLTFRYGWLLEDMTFEDFGFRSNIMPDELLWDSSAFGNTPLHLVKNGIEGVQREQRRKDAVQKMMAWWDRGKFDISWREDRRDWNWSTGLLEALKSEDRSRQLRAMVWLREHNFDAHCFGDDTTRTGVISEIRRLSEGETGIIKEAALEITSKVKRVPSDDRK